MNEMRSTQKPKRIVVTGSRGLYKGWYDYFEEKMLALLAKSTPDEVVIASGVAGNCPDILASEFAVEHGYEFEAFPAMWKQYGRSAGMIRNAEMVKWGTHVVAFWDGHSNGTRHCFNLAKRKGLYVVVYNVTSGKVERWLKPELPVRRKSPETPAGRPESDFDGTPTSSYKELPY